MDEIRKRGLPDLLRLKDGTIATATTWPQRRKEILNTLESELFGSLPALPFTWRCEVEREENKYYHGGNSIIRMVRMHVTVDGKPFTWQFFYSIPKRDHPVPVFLLPMFTKLLPVDFVPAEEICDSGYGVVCFDYQTVTSDDGDFSNGLAKLFYPNGTRGEHDGGKIALWVWAAMRIMDHLQTVREIDPKRVIVTGHSRLGKTALWAGAQDERFGGVVAVQSGCAGAAIARGNTGETVRAITDQFPFWFAPAYAKYADREESMPFDQHFLLSMAAPRGLYVASASEDLWADPLGEFLSCVAVSPAYEINGLTGFVASEPLKEHMVCHEGMVGYSRRGGTHFFSRLDWQRIIAFFNQKEADE